MKKFKFRQSINFDNLANLIKDLKEQGFKEEDFKKVEFKLDFSECYYESDTPGIIAFIK